MALGAFGTAFTTPSGISPYGPQGLGINPYAFQHYMQSQPLMSAPLSSPFGQTAAPLQQSLPLLQIVPQQLHQLQQLVSVQLQALQQVQQVVQFLPAQLQQIQQLIQIVTQQLQQVQSPYQASQYQASQPFAQPANGGIGSPVWGLGLQPFGITPTQLM